MSPCFALDGRPLILASASPRRAAMLKEAGIDFIVRPADIDEQGISADSLQELPRAIACAKARAVACFYPQEVILAADTIVCLGERLFGKPKNLEDAAQTLRILSGQTHRVMTGVALMQGEHICSWCSVSFVTFKSLTDEDIQTYLSLVNPLDKAGAYAIQEQGDRIVKSISGLKSNIIGLPIEEILEKLMMKTQNPH